MGFDERIGQTRLTPRYQLPADFGALPPGFREEFNQWALEFFGTVEESTTGAPCEHVVYVPEQPPQSRAVRRANGVSPKRKNKRSPGRRKVENLSDLLDNISLTFKHLRAPDMKNSWLPRDDRIGLRRLGIYVPHPYLMPFNDDQPIPCDVSKGFPTMMFLSFPGGDSTDEYMIKRKFVPARMMFALKIDKLPSVVSRKPGVPYKFGFAMGDFKQLDCLDLAWIYGFLSIEEGTGRVHICDELTEQKVAIEAKSPTSRKRAGKETITYSVNKWGPPRLWDLAVRSEEKWRINECNFFSAMFNWWNSRKDRWSVAVSDGSDRVTFSIDQANTSSWFADRDKSVNKKKIIHFVNQHDRLVRGKTVSVKAHVRGIREFDWNGYHCLVTAPKFTNFDLITSAFDVTPTTVDEDAEEQKTWMNTSELGSVLALLEDTDKRHETRSTKEILRTVRDQFLPAPRDVN